MGLKKFESFMEDRERERLLNKEREQEIIATFSEPKGVEVELSTYDETPEPTAEETLAMGKTIADEFPVDLVAEPEQTDFSTEQEIIDQFPLEVAEEQPTEEETAPVHVEDETNAVTIDGFGTY